MAVRHRLWALLASAGTIVSAAPLFAQEAGASAETDGRALEEIIVTAERRVANVQKTATAVSVRNGEELAREGRFTLNQILEDVPGVSGLVATGSQNMGTDAPETGITIRGVRSNTGSAPVAASSTTAAYVDGIYGGIGNLYDIGRVEVLRGPQGTLYGRSATGGVIATYTRNPDTGNFGANALIELGSYQLRHYSGAVNVPIVADKLAVRVAGNLFRRNGFDSKEGQRYESDDARIKALWTPTDNLSVLLGFALQNTRSGTGGVTVRATGQSSYFKDFNVPIGSGSGKTRQYWAQVDWDLGFGRLTYIPAFRDYSQDGIFYPNAPTAGFYANEIGEPKSTFHTQELRLSSPAGSRLTWQVGGIYFKNIVDGAYSNQYYTLSNVFSSRRETARRITDKGIFAEATYPITDAFRVTAGVRHDWDKIRTNATLRVNSVRNNFPGTARVGTPNALANPPQSCSSLSQTSAGSCDQTFTVSGAASIQDVNETTWKARLEADLSPDNLVYGMVSTAFLPGDVQIASTTPPSPYVYTAEKLTAYEIGSKNRFFDRRLQINAAAYFYDYGGYQTTVNLDPTNPSLQVVVSQAMQMTGAELETLFQLTPVDRIAFDIAYVDARFVHVLPYFRSIVSQEKLFGIPPLTMSLRYDHRFRLPGGSDLRFDIDTRYASGYYANNVSTTIANAGGLPFARTTKRAFGNVSLDWTSAGGKFGITAYVRNVTNQRFRVIGSVIYQTVTPLNQTYRLSEPRTIGVILHANL